MTAFVFLFFPSFDMPVLLHADAALRDSGLDWTIIRPGRLTDEPATDAVRLAPEVEYGEIPRADVGAVLAAVLDEPGTVGQQVDLVAGNDTVADAVRALV